MCLLLTQSRHRFRRPRFDCSSHYTYGVRNVVLGAAMSANDTIDFWFTVGSTYTYLTVSRLNEIEKVSGIRFRWRPFNARAIMQEMNNAPFATKLLSVRSRVVCLHRTGALANDD